VRRALTLVVLAVAVAFGACAQGTTNGFSVTPPGGWEDRTDTAETRTRGEFEVVYAGTPVDGLASTITVSRIAVPKGGGARTSATAARAAVLDTFRAAAPTPLAPATLDGARGFGFDYRAGDKRARYLTVEHRGELYAATLEAAPTAYDRGMQVFDAFLRSWKWDKPAT